MHDLRGKIALIIGLGQTDSFDGGNINTNPTQYPDPPHALRNEGSSWGIGAAIAVVLARRGATIFGGNRTVASTTKTRETIESEGGNCDVVATDATSSESVKALVEACMAKHGRIDILVASVGHSQPGCPATMAEDVWDAQMDVNLRSVYLACHHVLPIMTGQTPTGGAIVCVSSIAGLRYIGKPQVAYSAAKAAIMQFVKATAIVYAQTGVRLNTVVPGLMETPYTRSLATRFPTTTTKKKTAAAAAVTTTTTKTMARESERGEEGDEAYEGFKRMRENQVPMGRMGDAWDVANAVLFLVSDESRYITGQKIVVDGGITSSTGRT
ncbi:oxidoreductase ucpA [Nemania abortiva]|nr:oxidoreductase ucpA [Nemania abortiva]